ncbi:hypothetical protein RFI_03558 [Reticulomyxa filosa]|uniref:Uncharacterized protein n=1 Tax=Reticulomyxa filosa TaxID=46433 RepID=X6P5Z5_RETFI|nr:hypothetical protein RFI_03558 [Reticulomyxa filosa]|eukprot:ETO33543.1 hypothetical protein RFI_03558 [Reticulomyxa filosa]
MIDFLHEKQHSDLIFFFKYTNRSILFKLFFCYKEPDWIYTFDLLQYEVQHCKKSLSDLLFAIFIIYGYMLFFAVVFNVDVCSFLYFFKLNILKINEKVKKMNIIGQIT